MYKVQVTYNVPELHTVFKAKLKRYGFTQTGKKQYTGPDTVDCLGAVNFYRKNLCSPMSPLFVTAQRTERIV